MSRSLPKILDRAAGAPAAPVLEFDQVTLRPTWPYDTALDAVSFALRPGELVLITLEPGHVRSPFADLTQALTHPHGGQIRFMGDAWTTMSAKQMSRRRGRLGRVFDVGGWVSNLDVDENVLLAQRHHNTAPAAELRKRADKLAKNFGLERVPRKRPAAASQLELRISQWVRALLGEMDLLVLERPTRDVPPEAIVPFLNAFAAARQRGTAILWVTTDGAASSSAQNIAPPDITARYGVRGTSLVAATG